VAEKQKLMNTGFFARGSLSDLWHHFLIEKDEKYLSPEKIDELYSQIKVVENLLHGYLSLFEQGKKETLAQ
jgi:hypothetical protein